MSTANYPNCHIKEAETEEGSRAEWETWSAELELEPELFPILRHAQFEDLLNGNFADPINSVLRAIKSDAHLQCRIEIVVAPAAAKHSRRATRAVQRLDREFFRHHHVLAHFYSRHATKRCGRFIARILGLFAAGTAAPSRSTLDTSASRMHDREDDLQAASEKIGGHLFETRIRLSVQASAEHQREAIRPHPPDGGRRGFLHQVATRDVSFRADPPRRSPDFPGPGLPALA